MKKKIFTVKHNWCNCHPETCCCDDWVVFDPEGKKHSTHFHKEVAEDICDALNERNKLMKKLEDLQIKKHE